MDIREIKGVGEKTEKYFNKLGIKTSGDLISYYPIHYIEYKKPIRIIDAKPGITAAIDAYTSSRPLTRGGSGKTVITLKISDETGSINVIWFNSAYLLGKLRYGSRFVFYGRITQKNNVLVMEHPQIYGIADYDNMMKGLMPVYGLTKGLKNSVVMRSVKEAIKTCGYSDDFLPEGLSDVLGLISENEALNLIHFPANKVELEKARRRLAFDEFFLFILEMKMLKNSYSDRKNMFPIKPSWEVEDMINSLPYKLTDAQMRTFREIEEDFAGNKLMNRLIQGDVGSGKTIVAFLAIVSAVLSGYQTALMAPTEVLASQHYDNFVLFMNDRYPQIKPVLLVGSLKASEKKDIHRRIRSGECNVIIGTHALIQSSVEYNNLALVITDEQHRFGVRARKKFTENENCPNMIVMSATPIPRTLGLIYFGDLDISLIDEKPAMRLPIKNCAVDTSYRPAAYRFIKNEIKSGRQAYIICPLIEENEESDLENVIDYSKKVKKEIPEASVGVLHGRMTAPEKEKVLNSFAEGETDIIVSTTVIEVGIDVPNATVMMIENAERFGLASLHQLRGRVGRGRYQSYCIFVCGSDREDAMDRLKIMTESNDGFEIAEKDFSMRGPGDLLGIRQSGDMRFRIADPLSDKELLKAAGECADSLLLDDPGLVSAENTVLRERLNDYLNEFDRNIVL